MIRCKFQCGRVEEFYFTVGGTNTATNRKQSEHVMLFAVYETDGPNRRWSEATPAGEVRMQITNPDAFGRFVEGQEYFLDFTPAAPAA